MEKIREMLARLGELSAEERAELRGLIVAEFDRVDGEEATKENVALLQELADAGDNVLAADEAAVAEQQERDAVKASTAERIARLKGEPEGDGEDADKAESEGEPEAEADAEVPAAEVEAPEPVTASAAPSAVVAISGRTPSGAVTPSPESRQVERRRPQVLVASGLGDTHGTDIDRESLSRAMCDQLGRMHRQGAARGVALVASADWTDQYPEERRLGADAERNGALMEAQSGLQAIIASGGICLPVNVDYEVPTWATAARPLRDGLDPYNASRGGVRFVEPPDIGALGAATGIWTEATDENPLAATKPVFSVACGSEQLVYVAAVSTRVGFGNMQSRFAPEQVAANTDLAIAAAARKAELNLLELIQAKAQATTAKTVKLGATRDLITAINETTAAFRYYHRIPREVKLCAIFPDWVKELIKIDLARELAHSQDESGYNSLAISPDQVDKLIEDHEVRPIWTLDSLAEKGSTPWTAATEWPSQQWAAQGTAAPLQFPKQTVWFLFPEGAIQFLDGGRLDLGVVRDSTLDATNDYETFVETFEGIANRGFSKAIMQLRTELIPSGATSATQSVTTE